MVLRGTGELGLSEVLGMARVAMVAGGRMAVRARLVRGRRKKEGC